jgi:hypothetical protein
MIGVIGYLFAPVLFLFWLQHGQGAGIFEVNADSIGIPMAKFTVLWFLGATITVSVSFTFIVSKLIGGK